MVFNESRRINSSCIFTRTICGALNGSCVCVCVGVVVIVEYVAVCEDDTGSVGGVLLELEWFRMPILLVVIRSWMRRTAHMLPSVQG